MNYSYVAYTKDKKLVKGKLSATSEEAAMNLLNYGGYQVIRVRQFTPFFNLGKLSSIFRRINQKEIVIFSRQLALLLESGSDIVASLELLQGQVTSKLLKQALGEVVTDIRSGSSLSAALRKHSNIFSQIYYRAISAGEKSGNLEVVLRQMADFIERRVVTEKKIKNAMTYPVIVVFVAIVVVVVMVTFVLPSFANLYSAVGSEQPMLVNILIGTTDWLNANGIYLLAALGVLAIAVWLYARTPAGKYQRDKLLLRLPILGRILLLGELSRSCRTMSLLFHVGLPLPEVLAMAIQGSGNKTVAEALTEVQRGLIRGEGLSKPMSKRPTFLPLMVQMANVGEETGNLDNTLATVAESYEMESDDRTNNAVELIQPVITIVIGIFIGFLAMTMVSAMYSVYGQMSI